MSSHPGEWIPDLFRETSPAVAMVEIWEGSTLTSRGTAFAIEPLAEDSIDSSIESILATNSHVVNTRATGVEIRIRFPKGLDNVATVRLADPMTDVAFLTAQAAAPAVLSMRTTDRMRVGESVIAIGNPHGFECSVSNGIVSGLDRVLNDTEPDEVYANLVQTDTPINAGNSGGPLIGRDGCVLGINSISRHNTDGLHFAVPSDTVLSHYRELVEFGDTVIKRATIGARIASHQFPLDQQRELNRRSGVRLGTIKGAAAPSAKAGLSQGDVIIEFRGELIENRYDLLMLLDRRSIGAPCEVKFVRNGQIQTTDLTPAERI